MRGARFAAGAAATTHRARLPSAQHLHTVGASSIASSLRVSRHTTCDGIASRLQTRSFVSLLNVIPRAQQAPPREQRVPPPPLPAPQMLHLPSERCSIEYIDVSPAPQANPVNSSASTTPHATIVVLHGAPGTYHDYRHIIPLLQQRADASIRVIGVNLPGSGGSSVDAERYVDQISALPAATLTLRALEQLCAPHERVFLMGHSFGAHAVINIAALNQAKDSGKPEDASQSPLDVRGMVLLAPAGCRPHRVLRPKQNAAVVDLLKSSPPVFAHMLTYLIKILYTKMLGFSSDYPASHFVAGIVRAGTTDFDIITRHVRATQSTTPAFLAWSANDEFMEDEVPTELAQLCHPGGPRIAFAVGGHNIQKTRADVLANEVAQWVRTVLDTNSSSNAAAKTKPGETPVQEYP